MPIGWCALRNPAASDYRSPGRQIHIHSICTRVHCVGTLERAGAEPGSAEEEIGTPTVDWNRIRWARDVSDRAKREEPFYGLRWGDPEASRLRYWFLRLTQKRPPPGYLRAALDKYLRPYVKPDSTVVEIGSGGGRWTKYLLEARKIFAVDVSSEFFPILEERFPDAKDKFVFYQTSGTELDAIDSETIDFVCSFGVFVHIDPEDIDAYLGEIKRVLKPGAFATIHYADKTKKRARRNSSFSDMTPARMESLLSEHGMRLVKHDTKRLNHSSIAVFQK